MKRYGAEELVWIKWDIATIVCPLSYYSYFLCECLHSNGLSSRSLCNVKWNVCDNFINVACLENVLEIKCNIWFWHESLQIFRNWNSHAQQKSVNFFCKFNLKLPHSLKPLKNFKNSLPQSEQKRQRQQCSNKKSLIYST